MSWIRERSFDHNRCRFGEAPLKPTHVEHAGPHLQGIYLDTHLETHESKTNLDFESIGALHAGYDRFHKHYAHGIMDMNFFRPWSHPKAAEIAADLGQTIHLAAPAASEGSAICTHRLKAGCGTARCFLHQRSHNRYGHTVSNMISPMYVST